MSRTQKRLRRDLFRKACFSRDGNRCVMCGCGETLFLLAAHHIRDRSDCQDGGYRLDNLITLCNQAGGCHWKAEWFHATGVSYPGYSPEDLANAIGAKS